MDGLARAFTGGTLVALALGPLGKLSPLFPNIHEPRSNFEDPERIPAEVLFNLSCTISEPVRSLALNLSCPHVPSDWAELGGPHDEAKAHHQRRSYRLDADVQRQ